MPPETRKRVCSLGGKANALRHRVDIPSSNCYKALLMKVAGASNKEILQECGFSYPTLRRFLGEDSVKEVIDWAYRCGVLAIESALQAITARIAAGDAYLAFDFYKFMVGKHRGGEEAAAIINIDIGCATPPWAPPTVTLHPGQPPKALVESPKEDNVPSEAT